MYTGDDAVGKRALRNIADQGAACVRVLAGDWLLQERQQPTTEQGAACVRALAGGWLLQQRRWSRQRSSGRRLRRGGS